MSVYTPPEPPAIPEDFPPPAALTEEQTAMHTKVLEHFSKSEYTLPDTEKGELLEDEKFWLSHECMLRYLRAVKWSSAEKAISRLEATLKWRREYGIEQVVTAPHVEPEALTGKQVLFGFDTARRPAFYMIPSRQNTAEGPRQVQYTVYMLERCIDLMGPGVETLDLLINYADKAKNPSISVAHTVLNILQEHYPERLGLALILNVPWLLNAFYKLITPFIDPVTRPKMKFNPVVIDDKIFTPDMVMKEWWGGDQDFVYKHEMYWPALVQMCERRKKEQMERWRALGGTVGLKEWEVKGGDPKAASAEKTVEIAVTVELVQPIETQT